MGLKNLIGWLDVMTHYMKIALYVEKGGLSPARIDFDEKDLEYMIAILEVLKTYKTEIEEG